jgi:hypothetical protein
MHRARPVQFLAKVFYPAHRLGFGTQLTLVVSAQRSEDFLAFPWIDLIEEVKGAAANRNQIRHEDRKGRLALKTLEERARRWHCPVFQGNAQGRGPR